MIERKYQRKGEKVIAAVDLTFTGDFPKGSTGTIKEISPYYAFVDFGDKRIIWAEWDELDLVDRG